VGPLALRELVLGTAVLPVDLDWLACMITLTGSLVQAGAAWTSGVGGLVVLPWCSERLVEEVGRPW
jgi:hypothetical protein